MKRKNLLKVFGISYNKNTTIENLHKWNKWNMQKPLWNLTNGNPSNKFGFRGRVL